MNITLDTLESVSRAFREARNAFVPHTAYDAWTIDYRKTPVADVRAEVEREAKAEKTNEARIATERCLVRHFIRTAKAAGFDVHSVDDGETRNKVRNETEAMAAVFSVDDSTVYFSKTSEPGRARECLVVVLGNGVDCLADMSCGRADWDAVLETSNRYVDEQDA